MTTYGLCKKVIQIGNYGTKEDMQIKLDVFMLHGRISQEEYEELNTMLYA